MVTFQEKEKYQKKGLFPYCDHYDLKLPTYNLKFYVDCLLNQYGHLYPIVLDKLFRQQGYRLKDAIKELHRICPIEQERLYRGIFIPPRFIYEKDGKEFLKNKKTMTYLSFSADIEVAKNFADRCFELNLLMQKRMIEETFKGYLIFYFNEGNNVLFHYKWTDFLGLFDHPELDLKNQDFSIKDQKEVVLWNQGHDFEVISY